MLVCLIKVKNYLFKSIKQLIWSSTQEEYTNKCKFGSQIQCFTSAIMKSNYGNIKKTHEFWS